jgi:hypothetical protein
MIKHHQDKLSDALASAVLSAQRAPQDSVVAEAQHRLEARLASQPDQHQLLSNQWLRRGAFAGASLVAIAVVAWLLPVLSGSSDAFASVQNRLRSFQSMVLEVTQRYDGQLLQQSRTTANASQVVRTDIGNSLSIIVDPIHGRLLMLDHQRRQAVLSFIAKNENVPSAPDQLPSAPDSVLAVLAQIRDFQGKATLIDARRVIDGKPARGWRLKLQGNAIELWADAQGWPLQMQMHTSAGAGLVIDYRFAFDQAIVEGLLSSELPAGYALTTADDDE